MSALILHPLKTVQLGCTTFVDCSTLIQVNDVPLLEVFQHQNTFMAKCRVYHPNGDFLGVVDGARFHKSEAGKKIPSLKHRFFADHQAIELDGKTLLELRGDKRGPCKGHAELSSPDGLIVRAPEADDLRHLNRNSLVAGTLLIDDTGFQLVGGGKVSINGEVSGAPIGIWIRSDSVIIAANPVTGSGAIEMRRPVI